MFKIEIETGEVEEPLRILPEEFDKICRLCLKKNSTRNIFDKNQKYGGKFKKLLESLFLLNVEENDGLPQRICNTCASLLNGFNFFKEQINGAQIILNVVVGKVKFDVNEFKTSRDVEPEMNEVMRNLSSKDEIEIEYQDFNADLVNSNDITSAFGSDEEKIKLEYECQFCGEQCEDRDLFLKHRSRKHQKRVRKKKPCPTCQKLIMVEHLPDHMNIHTDSRPYVCGVCSKAFRSLPNWYSHKKTHVGIRPYKCDVCGQRFTEATDLVKHMKLHNKEVSFVCDMCCFVSFTNREFLEHQMIHDPHKVPRRKGPIPYGKKYCEICQKKFCSYQAAEIHMRRHTGERPFKCDKCHKAFTQQGHLATHTKLHTGEKPYICSYCGKRFTLTGNLQQHVMTHTGEKPHQCDVCEKRYYTNSSLTKHKAVHIKRDCDSEESPEK